MNWERCTLVYMFLSSIADSVILSAICPICFSCFQALSFLSVLFRIFTRSLSANSSTNHHSKQHARHPISTPG